MGRQAPGPTPTPGPRPSGPRAACRGRRRRTQCSRPPARAPRRCRGAPWDEPPPCSGPYSRTGEGGAAPPLNDPASPAPIPPETSVRLVPPGLRFPTPDQRRGVSARPTQPRGGLRPPPDQSASLAAATSRLRRALSRGLPERQAGRLPARPIEGPQVDRSACGGERGLPGVPSLHNKSPTPLLKKQVGRS